MKTSISKSTVMAIAHKLVSKSHITLSEALKKAWKACKLQFRLRSENVRFTFRKVNGEIREAFGTLNLKNVDANIIIKGTGYPTPLDVMRYFDLEKKAFRSFCVANLL